ncbi:hypothetical protein [Xanthomonas maliensis]|nr:hypothetical protein [Xanthomonas maliensis]
MCQRILFMVGAPFGQCSFCAHADSSDHARGVATAISDPIDGESLPCIGLKAMLMQRDNTARGRQAVAHGA